MAGADFTPFPTAQPTGAPSDYEKVNVNPEEFGSAIGQAEEGAGTKLEGTGKELFQSAMMRAEINNELWANDHNTQTTKQMGKMLGDFSDLRGEAAANGLDAYTSSITDLYKTALAAAPNMKARALLSQSMRIMGDRYIGYGQMHAKDEHTKWQNQSATDAADEHANQASQAAIHDDPVGMDQSLEALKGQWTKYGEQNGLADNSILALQHKAIGEAVGKIVEGTIASGNLDKARHIYEQYKDQMDINGITAVEKALKPAEIDAISTAKANAAITPNYGPAPAGFSNIERSHGLPAGYLTGTYGIESNFGRAADTGRAQGPFQFMPETAARYGLKDPHNLNQSAEAAARLGEDNMKTMTPFLGRAPSAGELYIAHQQGAGGAVSLLTHPDASAASLVGADKIAANLPASMKGLAETITARQFTQYWEGHFSGEAAGFVGQTPSPATSVMAPEGIAIDRLMSDPELASNPAALTKAVAKVHQTYSNWNMENKTTIDELNHNVPSLITQIESGDGDIDALAAQYPQEAVRNYLPNKAQEWEQEITDAQKIGTMVQGYKYESHDNVLAAQQDLASGHGPISEMIAKDATDPWEHARLVGLGTKRLEAVLKDRDAKMLGPTADPAAFVMGNKPVNEAAKAMVADPNNLALAEKYAATTINLQSNMGVPGRFTHVIPKDLAEQMTQQIVSNPSTARDTMAAYEKHWGRAWGNVVSDLVTLGKLPMDYMGLHVLTDKGDIATYSRALGESKKTDFADWSNALGYGDPQAGKQTKVGIDTAVEVGLAPYINSLRMSKTSDDEVNSVIRTVSLLAYGNKLYNNDSDPAGKAVKSFVSQYSYLFQGGARVPTDVYDTVNRNAVNMAEQLTVDNIRLPDKIGQPGQPSKDAYMAWLKSTPQWVTSERGDSIYLRDPLGEEVKGNDGNRLEVMFHGSQAYSPNFAPKIADPNAAIIQVYRDSLTKNGTLSPEQIDTMTSAYTKQLNDYRAARLRGEHVR